MSQRQPDREPIQLCGSIGGPIPFFAVPRPEADRYSISQINRAGKTIRYYLEGRETDTRRVHAAIDVVDWFRALHAYPLTKAGMGLRSMVKTVGFTPQVSQRLKRFPTIVDKLTREPTMGLSTMQDIGGCRAVLPSIDAVYTVAKRRTLRERRVGFRDYTRNRPNPAIRGVHVIVMYDHRRIEVQLRTPTQHEWAVTVERLGGRLDEDLKSGRGPKEILEFLQTVSEAMALEETSNTVPQELERLIIEKRRSAAPFLV